MDDSIRKAYLQKTLPIIPKITKKNPEYKQQVRTTISDFVQQLKSDKAPQITTMLIELSLNEIKKILKSYEFFCEKVNQSDALLARLMASAQDAASPKSK